MTGNGFWQNIFTLPWNLPSPLLEEKKKTRASERIREVAGSELSKTLYPSILTGCFQMVQARDQKECLKIHYARETFQETQQVWAAATFQSVCCVYLVHSGGFFSRKYLSFEWILFLFKVAWRWNIYALVSLTPCGAAPPCNKLCLFACLCVCAHVCVWLAWQPGLDVKHLSGDSFGRGCGVTPRHICRGVGDPRNLPLA